MRYSAPKINEISKEQYQLLLATGHLWNVYPECEGNYEEDSQATTQE